MYRRVNWMMTHELVTIGAGFALGIASTAAPPNALVADRQTRAPDDAPEPQHSTEPAARAFGATVGTGIIAAAAGHALGNSFASATGSVVPAATHAVTPTGFGPKLFAGTTTRF